MSLNSKNINKVKQKDKSKSILITKIKNIRRSEVIQESEKKMSQEIKIIDSQLDIHDFQSQFSDEVKPEGPCLDMGIGLIRKKPCEQKILGIESNSVYRKNISNINKINESGKKKNKCFSAAIKTNLEPGDDYKNYFKNIFKNDKKLYFTSEILKTVLEVYLMKSEYKRILTSDTVDFSVGFFTHIMGSEWINNYFMNTELPNMKNKTPQNYFDIFEPHVEKLKIYMSNEFEKEIVFSYLENHLWDGKKNFDSFFSHLEIEVIKKRNYRKMERNLINDSSKKNIYNIDKQLKIVNNIKINNTQNFNYIKIDVSQGVNNLNNTNTLDRGQMFNRSITLNLNGENSYEECQNNFEKENLNNLIHNCKNNSNNKIENNFDELKLNESDLSLFKNLDKAVQHLKKNYPYSIYTNNDTILCEIFMSLNGDLELIDEFLKDPMKNEYKRWTIDEDNILKTNLYSSANKNIKVKRKSELNQRKRFLQIE